jgi:hypothetical protein
LTPSPDYEELIGRLREPTGLDRPDLRAKLDEAAAALRQALAERDQYANWYDSERAHSTKLEAALMFWMPGVCEETDSGLERSAGDDAYLLAGTFADFPATCWGDDVLARATTAEARIAELTPLVKQAFMDGLTYATNVEVTDTEEAWRTSRVRALANEAES